MDDRQERFEDGSDTVARCLASHLVPLDDVASTGVTDNSGRADASDRADGSGRADANDRADGSDRVDANGRRDGNDRVDARDTLDVVGATVAGSDVIGLGEASHGTREFFTVKGRLVRHLVEEHDLRLIGLETDFAATLSINEYVLSGTGTAEDALSQPCIHEGYRTESMLGLIEWLCTFNEDRAPNDRVRCHGIDVQSASTATSRLETFFEAVDPDALSPIRDDLQTLVRDGVPSFSDSEKTCAHIEARSAVVETLRDTLVDHESAYVARAGRRAYERARRIIWTIEQGRRQFEAIHEGRADAGANVRIRDSAMAAQVQWLLEHEPGDWIAVWGHNAHLTRGPFAGGPVRHTQHIPSLGYNLAGLADVEYYALGLLLGGGTVGAVYTPEMAYREYEIDPPPQGSIPAVFGGVDSSAFFLDLRSLPDESPLSAWLDTGPPHFDVVGGYRESPVTLVESNLRRGFDGLVFVDETTAARPMSGDPD